MVHETDRRTRKRAERSRKILENAQTILLAEGLDAVTLHRIAREQDVTVGALYRYFSSKQELLTALGERTVRSFTLALEHMASAHRQQDTTGAQPNPLTQLMVIGFGFLKLVSASPAQYRMVDLMLVDPRTMVPQSERPRVLETLFNLLSQVENLLDESQKLDLIRDGIPRERTITLWSALLGVVSMRKMRKLYPEQIPAQNLARELIHSLFIAWGCSEKNLKMTTEEAIDFLATFSSDSHSGESSWL